MSLFGRNVPHGTNAWYSFLVMAVLGAVMGCSTEKDLEDCPVGTAGCACDAVSNACASGLYCNEGICKSRCGLEATAPVEGNECNAGEDSGDCPVGTAGCACDAASNACASGLSCNEGICMAPCGSEAVNLDILWMIDNSGSMCQEQKLIRDNFERFVDTLTSTDVDFHIGVTTTHMPDNYPLEPVAKPGHLQAKPQPIPGFDATCYHKLSPDWQIDRSDFEPVVEAINIAVECTQDPGQFANLRTPSPQQLRCAFYPNETGACPNGPVERGSLFPPSAAYRNIPNVLRAQDYRQPDQSLDIPRLKRDFACMSMVGTRGYGFEKGLSAVVRAVHPDLTGGPTGDPASFPNAGFLRQDARLGIIFVSDENDCTHNGSLNEQTSCGVAECSFRDDMGSANSPLVPVRELKGQLMQNLRASKGRQVSENEVLVASIHGQYRAFSQERPAECATGYNIPPSCASLQGIAYSGHRYEEFLREFPTYFPKSNRSNPEQPLDGLICSDFGPAIQDIATFFKSDGGRCDDRSMTGSGR